MKESFGQRLSRIRKEKGLTQEDVASRITISPQAVSKWENDISSPDISVLSQLADMFGVSVDELLGREASEASSQTVHAEAIDDSVKFSKKEDDHVVIDESGIHLKGHNGSVDIDNDGFRCHVEAKKMSFKNRSKENTLASVISSSLFLLSIVGYIICGLLWTHHSMGWACGWTLILFGISLSSLVIAIYKRKTSHFAYPVFITGVYCLLGFLGAEFEFNGFGFYWFLFITIPVYYVIAHYVDHLLGTDDKDDED